jgi:hypothetical protein
VKAESATAQSWRSVRRNREFNRQFKRECKRESNRQSNRECGTTMVELLLALPVVMLLGLGIAQFTLIYQAKHALDYALTQAARQGAVDHASRESIRAGLAAGLAPYLYGASDWAGLLAAEARAGQHVDQGAAAGWIRLRQRSPSRESFDDWAEPALDTMGAPIPGLVEIANDNLDNRRLRMQPVSGLAGVHLSEPIGRLSGQTLADANLLRLELIYGVRLSVPVVGALIVRSLSLWNGCSLAGQWPGDSQAAQAFSPGAAASSGDRLGLLLLGSVGPLNAMQPWMCGFLDARDGEGRAVGRIPIRASATVRMMSTARRSELTQARIDAASGLGSLGPGLFEAADDAALAGERNDGSGSASPSRGRGGGSAGDGAAGASPLQSPRSSLANGFLDIGGDRSYPLPGTHPALCSQ